MSFKRGSNVVEYSLIAVLCAVVVGATIFNMSINERNDIINLFTQSLSGPSEGTHVSTTSYNSSNSPTNNENPDTEDDVETSGSYADILALYENYDDLTEEQLEELFEELIKACCTESCYTNWFTVVMSNIDSIYPVEFSTPIDIESFEDLEHIVLDPESQIWTWSTQYMENPSYNQARQTLTSLSKQDQATLTINTDAFYNVAVSEYESYVSASSSTSNSENGSHEATTLELEHDAALIKCSTLECMVGVYEDIYGPDS